MSELHKTHTYRGGEKIELEKSPEQIVVRALPENLDDSSIVKSEQVSPVFMRIYGSLQLLRGLSINAEWKQKVSDHVGLDQRKLNCWALQLSPV